MSNLVITVAATRVAVLGPVGVPSNAKPGKKRAARDSNLMRCYRCAHKATLDLQKSIHIYSCKSLICGCFLEKKKFSWIF